MTVALVRRTMERWPAPRMGGADDLRYAVLATAVSRTLQDRLDLAHLALRQGDRQAALLLLAGVGLELGFSAGATEWWRYAGESTGLWRVAWPVIAAGASTFMVDAALAEMRAVMGTIVEALPDAGGSTSPQPVLNSSSPAPADVPEKADFVERALATFFADPHPRASQLIAALAPLRRWSAFDARRWTGSPTGILVRMVALESLRTLTVMAHEFLIPPLGSPALLDHAARLADGGLGPWFGNLPRLVRSDEDMLAWPMAIGSEGLLPALLPRWYVLLATSAPRPRWDGLVREFGRCGMAAGLEAALGRLRRCPFADDHCGADRHVRDVSVDRDLPLVALKAQQQIVADGPDIEGERATLVDMLGMLGEEAQALGVAEEGLREDPLDPVLLRRIDVLRRGEIVAFASSRDFFGDADRGAQRRRAFHSRPIG